VCGIFAFVGLCPTPEKLCAAVEAVRHRGQSGFGVWAASNPGPDSAITHLIQTGPVQMALLPLLCGPDVRSLVAHWRYATRGVRSPVNSQPILVDGGNAVIAQNGQLEFAASDPRDSYSDTYRLARRIEEVRSGQLADRLIAAFDSVTGAAAIVAADENSLVALQDPFAIRPLFYGEYDGGWAVASEIPALRVIGVKHAIPVGPGQVLKFEPRKRCQIMRQGSHAQKRCAFEYVYFHSGNGELDGKSVFSWRRRLGRQLAREAPCASADIVVSVPRSANPTAEGFAAEAGLEKSDAIECVPGVQRTFIERDASRLRTMENKYRFLRPMIERKSVVVVDDSIVRGDTIRYIARQLRLNGATAVHARIGCPPFLFPCHFGIDVPDQEQLIGANVSMLELGSRLGLDSLGFLAVDGLKRALRTEALCTGCFNQAYPGAWQVRSKLPAPNANEHQDRR